MRRATTSPTTTVLRARRQRPTTRQTTGTDPAGTESRVEATPRISVALLQYGNFCNKRGTICRRGLSIIYVIFFAFSRPVLILLVISLLVATSLLVGTVLQYTQLRNTIRSLGAATATANTNLEIPSNETDVEMRPKISYGRLGSRYGFFPHNNLWIINRLD